MKKATYSKQGTRAFAIIFAMIAIWGFVSIVSPAPQIKSEETSQSLNSQGIYSGYLTRVVVITLTMIVILIVGLKMYKKQIGLKGNSSLRLSVLGKHYINNKQYLLKVNIEDRYMLLGVSESSINFITELENADENMDDDSKNFGTILDIETEEVQKV